MRVENQKHFGIHCVGKQCLDITMATCYNKQQPVVTAASMHGLTTFVVGYFSKILDVVCCGMAVTAGLALYRGPGKAFSFGLIWLPDTGPRLFQG